MHFFEEGKIPPYLYLNTGGKMFQGSISALIEDHSFHKILFEKMKDNLSIRLKKARDNKVHNEIKENHHIPINEDFSIFIDCSEMISLLSIIISFCGKTKYIGSKSKDSTKGDKAIINLRAKINEIKEIELLKEDFFPTESFEYYNLLKSLERITVSMQHESLFQTVKTINERISYINNEKQKLKILLHRILDDSFKLKDFSIASYATVLLNEYIQKYVSSNSSTELTYENLVNEAKQHFQDPGALDMRKLDDLTKIELKQCEYEQCLEGCKCEVISKIYYLDKDGQLADEYSFKNCLVPKCNGCGGERLPSRYEDGKYDFDQPPPFCRSSFYKKNEDWYINLNTERQFTQNSVYWSFTPVRFVPYAYWHHEYPVLK